ncbi:MAG TPA: O-antigen ligase family protein [Verrucomicrobiae bacterium]
MSNRESKESAPAAASAVVAWVFAGLVVLLLLAPLVFWRELYDSLSVPKRALIQVVALGLCALVFFQGRVRRLPQPIGFFVCAFLLWALVSLTWAVNPWLGWWTWWQWVACALIAWVVWQVELTPVRLRALLWAMAGSGAVVAVIGLAQVWFQWSWVPQAIAPGSTLANRNMAAQVMVLVIPVATVLLYMARCRREFGLALGALTLCVTFLGHTFTKGCWIACVVSGAVALMLGWKVGWRPSFGSARFKGLVFAAVVAAVLINVTAQGPRWRWPEIGAYLTGLAEEPEEKVSEADRLQAKSSKSVAVRTVYWRNTLEMLREHPVQGVGLNNWRVVYPAATLKGVTDVTMASSSPERTHNDLLQVWAELGTVGLLLGLAVVGLFLREVWRGLHHVREREERIVLIGAVAALGAIAVDSLFSFPLDREVPPLFGAVLLGLILQIIKGNGGTPHPQSFSPPRGEGRITEASSPLPSPPTPEERGFATGGLIDSKYSRALAVAVFIGAVFMGLWHVRQWGADGFFKQQLAAMRRADWTEVVRLGNRIKELDPTRVDAWRFTGRAQYQLGQFDEAWMDLKLVQRYLPDDSQVLYYLAQCAQKRGQFTQAEELLRRVAAILPKEALYPHHLGLLYLAQQDAVGALRELQRAQELNPQDAAVYFNLGLTYELAGKKAEAVVSFRKAGELRPNWEEAMGKARSLKE